MIYFAYKEEESTMFIRSELKNLAKRYYSQFIKKFSTILKKIRRKREGK